MAGQGIFSKKRYNPQAHQALNDHVNGLIHETYSVNSVRQHIEESEETAGTAVGVAPGAIDTAKGIVKDVLKTRLRESASDAIFVGSRRQGADHLNKFDTTLSDAKDCHWLDGEIDFSEFSLLLKNFQVRKEASRTCKELDHDSIHDLVTQLEMHVEPPAEGEAPHAPLTDATLAIVLHALLRLMQESHEASTEILGLRVVQLVGRLFLSSDLHYKVQGPSADHPEVQLSMAKLLAEVAYQNAIECCNSIPSNLRSGSAAHMRRSMAGFVPTVRLPDPPPLSSDAVFAIKTLLRGFKRSITASEHAPVWAVIVALHRLVEQPLACRCLLERGILQLLEEAREHYGGNDGSRLPVAIPRPKPRPPTVSKSVPSFTGAVAIPPALDRPSQSVKERFEVFAANSPHGLRLKRASIEFLAGSPQARSARSPKARSPTMRRSKTQPSLGSMKKSGAFITMPLGQDQHSQKQVPRSSAAKALELKSRSEYYSNEESKYPSLLWLIGEDRVDKESYYRVCDKNFIMLQLQKLIWAIERVKQKMPEVRPLGPESTAPPSRGIMSGSPTATRTLGGRPRLSPLANPPRGTHQLM